MRIIFSFILMIEMVLPLSLRAADGVEVHNMNEMISNIHLEKKQFEKIVDRMVSTGRLTVEEGARARRDIASVRDEDLTEVKKQLNTKTSSK